ncbi:MAG TPA: ATP-dependent DNA helicase, partial [Rhodospirillaceae bacterium]|nr:ATP-dependent DNA helicase [Rhodospirillaceae bacterium]
MTASGGPYPQLRDVPALVVGVRHAAWLTPEGEIETLTPAEASRRVRKTDRVMVCHAKATARRLNLQSIPALDLLELFAFCRPAKFCLPTPRGLAEALNLALPASHEAEAEVLALAAHRLLTELGQEGRGDTAAIAWSMGRGGWPWTSAVLAALGAGEEPHSASTRRGLMIWQRLPDWEDEAPPPP